MKFKKSFRSGFTLIELMLVVAIISILASIAVPRYDLMTQRSWQATTKSNLGAIRSTISLYYSDQEGIWPMGTHAAGYPGPTESLSGILAPRYIKKLPTPKVLDRVGSFNGLPLNYDSESAAWMNQSPPRDVVIVLGAQGPTPLINRPYVYNPLIGLIYLCNGNYDIAGTRFYEY